MLHILCSKRCQSNAWKSGHKSVCAPPTTIHSVQQALLSDGGVLTHIFRQLWPDVLQFAGAFATAHRLASELASLALADVPLVTTTYIPSQLCRLYVLRRSSLFVANNSQSNFHDDSLWYTDHDGGHQYSQQIWWTDRDMFESFKAAAIVQADYDEAAWCTAMAAQKAAARSWCLSDPQLWCPPPEEPEVINMEFSACYCAGNVVLGRGVDDEADICSCYNIVSRSWFTIPSPPTELSDASLCSLPDGTLVHSGGAKDGLMGLDGLQRTERSWECNAVWSWEWSGDTWTALPSFTS